MIILDVFFTALFAFSISIAFLNLGIAVKLYPESDYVFNFFVVVAFLFIAILVLKIWGVDY